MSSAAQPLSLPTLRRKLPFSMPSTYDLPWTTRVPMFPLTQAQLDSGRRPIMTRAETPRTSRPASRPPRGGLTSARAPPIVRRGNTPRRLGPGDDLEPPLDMSTWSMPSSAFGVQPNSLRESPQGFRYHSVYGASRRPLGRLQSRGEMATLSSARGPSSSRPSTSFDPMLMPWPLYVHTPSVGPQPTSIHESAARAHIGMTDDRWSFQERAMRACATPGPGAYSPTS